jgi:hypothetical protein
MRIVFFRRQMLIGSASAYRSDPFDVSGATLIKVLYQPFGTMGTPLTAVTLFTSDTLREGDWVNSVVLAPNTVMPTPVMMKYVRIQIEIDATGGTNAETLQVFGQALRSS